VIDETVRHFGRLDILVNNAGIGAGKSIEEITLEEWRWVMSVNLDGVFREEWQWRSRGAAGV